MSKNNLHIGDGEPVHSELVHTYVIDGKAYGLVEVIEAARGYKSVETAEAWNALKMAEKLSAIKSYLDAVNAEVPEKGEDTGVDEPADDAPKTAEEILAEADVPVTTPEPSEQDTELQLLRQKVALLEEENAGMVRTAARLTQDRDEWRGKAAGLRDKLDTQAAQTKEANSLHGHMDNLKAPY